MPRVLFLCFACLTLSLLMPACNAEPSNEPSDPDQGQDFFVTLQYHHVDDETPASTSVRVAQFQQQLDYLAENDFSILALDHALEALKQGERLPNRSLVITFDDSYESIYHQAYPRLKARGWPFTVFINTDPIDRGQTGMLSWEQLREMQDNGALIANHSVSHPHFPRHYGGQGARWQEWAREQIAQVEQRLVDELGATAKLFAWPYGEYNNAATALLDDMDLIGFGQHSGVVGPQADWHALPRFAINVHYSDMSQLALKMHAKPMPVIEMQPEEPTLSPNQRRPALDIELAETPPSGGWKQAINCFVAGQGRTEVEWHSDTRFTLQARHPLDPGRNRYNCTARDDDGRFYWISRQWLLPKPDGSWPAE